MKTYRDFTVWQKAHDCTVNLYSVTRRFLQEELHRLMSQIRRATVSITSNIAEGFGRSGGKEKNQFCAIAHGSVYEVENQVLIARGIGYLSDKDCEKFLLSIDEVSRLLQGLRKANKERS